MITAQVIINKSINVPIPARRVPSRPRLYLASHKNENGEVTIFDADGRELTRQQGALTTQTEYDPQGRLHKHYAQHTNTKERPIHREYGYDPAGNLNLLKEGIDETKYVYDALHRLKLAAKASPEFFDFDPAGNLISIANTPTATPGVVKGNRLLLQGDKHFDYDARGNLIQETRGKDGKLQTQFVYNLNNQLIEVNSTQRDKRVTFKYDPLGRRIEKQDAFGVTKYLWTDNLLTQEVRYNNKKTYVYEPGSFKPLAQIQDNQVYHYHLDHLGTPRELTNEQGKIVWKARYKTYGNLALKEVDEVENNLRFQGQYFDEETGLHYNRFRYYSPDTGQFINQDPIGLLGGLNNYQYAPNPISWIDPLGLCKEQYSVGPYNEIKGTVAGMDAHHVGQKALMKNMIPGYEPDTAPSILVPKVGHTIRGPNGIVSRGIEGLNNPRDVLARDINELRRVYPDIPNQQLQKLAQMNKDSYPNAFTKIKEVI